MKLTSKKVQEYFAWRTDEELRHCPDCIALACNDIAEEYGCTDFARAAEPIDYMKLLFFNDPVKGLFTHNYGFHTRTGRNIIETLKEKYYKYEQNNNIY
jgi:hypothetical protein